MKIKDIEKKIGTLSNPSKMPSYAWGISAKHCNVGSKLAKIKGTICNKCYALKGHYAFKNVFDTKSSSDVTSYGSPILFQLYVLAP
mgnify:CR=1 FL=1